MCIRDRIWGIAVVVLALVGYLTGLSDPTNPGPSTVVFGMLSFVISIGCVVKAIQEHRAELGGYIRGGRCVAVGLWAGLAYGIIYAIWTVIFLNFIAPDFWTDMMETQRALMESQGQSDEQIDMALGILEMVQGPVSSFLTSILGGLFSGLLISAISALFLKKRAPGQF